MEGLAMNEEDIEWKKQFVTRMEKQELIEWLAMMFAALADGRLWDDLTPRSRYNEFNWRKE